MLGKLLGLHDDLAPQGANPAAQATLDTLTTSVQHLEARRAQLAYATFHAAGYRGPSGAAAAAWKAPTRWWRRR